MKNSNGTIAAIRFGYGLHPKQTTPGGPDAVLASLKAGAAASPMFPSEPMDQRMARLQEMRDANKNDRKGEAAKARRRKVVQYFQAEAAQRVLERALSPHGFYQRLCSFWADHFTVEARNMAHNLVMPHFEIAAIRPHVLGNFEEMLVAVSRNPVMLHYLDQVQSFGPNSSAGKKTRRGLNENFAREILELHTLGVGAAYTQKDVREFAELLTGYSARNGYGEFHFQAARAEPGAETVLGRTYGGGNPTPQDAEAALRDLARHPATARHIARKLAVHFVADEPEQDLIAHVEAAYARSGGHLPTVYAALVEHPAAWQPLGGKVKQPFDLVVSTLRAIGIDGTQPLSLGNKTNNFLLHALKSMNQSMFSAPGPDGWPEEAEAWITPQGLAARLNFAARVGQILAKRTDMDPRRFAEVALADALRPETALVVGGAPERWEGFSLVIASPEFNRR